MGAQSEPPVAEGPSSSTDLAPAEPGTAERFWIKRDHEDQDVPDVEEASGPL